MRASIKICRLSGFTSGSGLRISIRRRPPPGSSRVTLSARAFPVLIAYGPLNLYFEHHVGHEALDGSLDCCWVKARSNSCATARKTWWTCFSPLASQTGPAHGGRTTGTLDLPVNQVEAHTIMRRAVVAG